MRHRLALFGYVILVAAVGLAFLFAQLSYDDAVRHADHNRCHEYALIWIVGHTIVVDLTEHVVIPVDQRHDLAVLERAQVTDAHRDLQRARLLAELGPRPHC